MVVDVQESTGGYSGCSLCMILSWRGGMNMAGSGRAAVRYRSDEFGKQKGLSLRGLFAISLRPNPR